MNKIKQILKKNKLFYWIYIRLVAKINSIKSKLQFKNEFKHFQKLKENSNSNLSLAWEDRWPILGEKTSTTGFDRHYVFFTAWAARKLAETKPISHTDISSSLHFCTIVSAFIPVKFFDYRPANLPLNNLTSEKCDLTSLHFEDNSIASLSCMHVIEHIGLGRYGDPLDPDGDLKAISELKRVTAIGGNLFFVVPMGESKIQFNAHRLYSYANVLQQFKEFELVEFSLIPDSEEDGQLIENASKEFADKQRYACGCFWFQKRA